MIDQSDQRALLSFVILFEYDGSENPAQTVFKVIVSRLFRSKYQILAAGLFRRHINININTVWEQDRENESRFGCWKTLWVSDKDESNVWLDETNWKVAKI